MAKRKSMTRSQWARVAVQAAQCRSLLTTMLNELGGFQKKADVSMVANLIRDLDRFKLRLVTLAAPDFGPVATNIFFHECHPCPEITDSDLELLATAINRADSEANDRATLISILADLDAKGKL